MPRAIWALNSAVATGDSSKQRLANTEGVGLCWNALAEAKDSSPSARRNASLQQYDNSRSEVELAMARAARET